MEHVVQLFGGWGPLDDFDPFSAASIPSIGSAPWLCERMMN